MLLQRESAGMSRKKIKFADGEEKKETGIGQNAKEKKLGQKKHHAEGREYPPRGLVEKKSF